MWTDSDDDDLGLSGLKNCFLKIIYFCTVYSEVEVYLMLDYHFLIIEKLSLLEFNLYVRVHIIYPFIFFVNI